ncbi:oleosin-like [Ipomoea triloba]|uniref:oleosin-like n=1 Tax=Ipomoea triloba TaxID=35885 RepID=UPI00125E1956|nr:oleosin-like [Ipomoea triloba]
MAENTYRNPQNQPHHFTHGSDHGMKSYKDDDNFTTTPHNNNNGPTTQQILAFVTLLPLGALLLGLSGLTFVGTLIALAIATPLFLLFSPVIVPAALTIALAVAGFLASGAFGITALSSLYWLANYVRRNRGKAREQIEHAKWRLHEYPAGQKIRDLGQKIQESVR